MSSIKGLSRVLSDDKIIESKLLNVLGVQLFRTLAAHLVHNLRQVDNPDVVFEQISTLRRDGLLVWSNFLPADQFREIRREFLETVNQPSSKTKTHHQGENLLEVTSLSHYKQTQLPQMSTFFADPRLAAILTAAEKRPLQRLWNYGHLEVLTRGAEEGKEDPESTLHTDIFFNTHKAWFYLDDVEIEDGPLVYVKGSHRLNLRGLSSLYLESWQRDAGTNPSRRASKFESKQLADRETIVTCKQNTLVIANTCGYHRRLPGREGRKRRALHIFLRANPFFLHGLRQRLNDYPRVYQFLRNVNRSCAGK
ncbi:MAG TPA: phytanoyl-CoA dioxygenase family protein [Pyrinomonadaceae bacterium]